jgi:thiamine-phosphate pyrophosphorylase
MGKRLPCVWLMTDERVAQADLLRAIARLPRGSAIVVRHYTLDDVARRGLFERVRRVAWRRGCVVLLADDPAQARAWGADGHHGRARVERGMGVCARPWLHSAPVHDSRELVAARRAGADAILLSPLMATRSHPGARPLGAFRFAMLARRSPVPVIALGGVRPRHAGLVSQLGASGFAAIDGLIPRK